ncbi:MAG: type I-A CRISPR-associated protein Cas4/Csa1 [Sulfolobales archaeon]
MVVKSEVLLKWLRTLRYLAEGYPVEPELRGWSWQSPPVRPRSYLGLAVQDVASYCPTRRDTWLRRVVGVRAQPTPPMRVGLEVHGVVTSVTAVLRRYLFSNYSPAVLSREVEKAVELHTKNCPTRECAQVVRGVGWLTYHTLVSDWLWSSYGVMPVPAMALFSELRVDGSPIGLSNNMRVDAIPMANVVVDLKTGKRSDVHELALAAYALALEASLEAPVDYGLLVYVWWNGALQVETRGVYIGPDLRKSFLDARDEVIDMLLTKREPQVAVDCPQTCPYLEVCRVENPSS